MHLIHISSLFALFLLVQAKTASLESALLPYVFDPLPLGSIRPQGWLRDQMQLMSDGLAGHQHDFYRFVKDSSWTGGDQEYSTLNEAWPYWFNGIVPLAYALDDTRLKQQVRSAVNYLFDSQYEDGWLGPESTPQTRMLWPRTLVMMGLTQFLEAEPAEIPRLLPKVYKFIELVHSMLADDYLGYLGRPDSEFDYHWGITRSQDMIISIQWLYDNYPGEYGQVLLEIMQFYNEKAWDWAYFYSSEVFPKEDLDVKLPPDEDLFWYYHGVNSAMGLKAGAVVRRFTHNETLVHISKRGIDWTFKYHGSPSGSIIGDEPWSGLSPSRGSELCTTVEAIYSLGYLYQAFGDWQYSDRSELAAFNALPVAVSPDWWSHQYMTQINQPYSRDLIDTPFNNVNSLGQTFGLEPDYPCCTVNHHQGFPKFLSSTYVKVGNNGVGHAMLSPSKLTTTLKDGNKVVIDCKTIYPFGEKLTYTVNADKGFTFFIKIPQWAVQSASHVEINGKLPQPVKPDLSSGFHSISIPAGATVITLQLSATTRIVPRQRDTVSIYRGALLYAIEIPHTISSASPRAYRSLEPIPTKWLHPHAKDYTLENTTSWNIAIDPSTLKFFSAESEDVVLKNPIFAAGSPPTKMTVMGCEIEWGLHKGSPADPPLPEERKCLGDFFEVVMIPYGAAKLHMAELPTVSYS
ncbi:hypothetical protein BP5796_08736 [Coleophoma crateriformis]|uniref:Non-reducing end beta-L-arabinofuranosidase-like GH127 middle domain-containing protein n=1 Tax=Coleophoma crateriformis TaxID=565419 RepID=A0A3D8R8G7_9HELO|nr:hypothetical protein BP5796_08736 [Coleophoma crateriformis]